MTTATAGSGRAEGRTPEELDIRLPGEHGAGLDQDEEWCEVKIDGVWRRIRFHDYAEIFTIDGLYEQLFHDRLECVSPERVVGLLEDCVAEAGNAEPLRAFDVGAGNGLVGAELRRVGAEAVVGLDILPEARDATLRERPEVYDRYLIDDLCDPSEATRRALSGLRANCLTVVAALGFNDIPPLAFVNAFNAVQLGSWVAFNVRDAFLAGEDDSGFASLVNAMTAEGVLDPIAYRKYVHRLNVAGDELLYVAMVARKRADAPASLLASLEG